jgi:hypothetical protein
VPLEVVIGNAPGWRTPRLALVPTHAALPYHSSRGWSRWQDWRAEARNWRIGLAEDLRDPAFAHAFVHACCDEGIPSSLIAGVKSEIEAVAAWKAARPSNRRTLPRRPRRALR